MRTALGIDDCIKRTPAAKPVSPKNLMRANPIIGPIITLTAPSIDACVQEITFYLVKAIPKDIKTKNIVV